MLFRPGTVPVPVPVLSLVTYFSKKSTDLFPKWVVTRISRKVSSLPPRLKIDNAFVHHFWSNLWLGFTKLDLWPLDLKMAATQSTVGTSPSTWNFGSNWQRLIEIANFLSIFAHITSAITSSEKCSINTNRKSTTGFPISPRWTSYVFPKPVRGLKNAKCSKFEQ